MSQSRIGSSNMPPAADGWPGNGGAVQGAGELRRAITAQKGVEGRVGAEAASMMGDLLARLDAFCEPAAPTALPWPSESGAAPMTPEQRWTAINRARTSLGECIQRAPDDASRQRLVALLKEVEAHTQLKQEVIMRVGSK